MSLIEERASFNAAAARALPYPESRYAGRGIVICAGGARLFTCAWILIGVLRRVVGCKLPIQVWHLGSEEIGPPMRALLQDAGVEVVDAHAVALHHPMRNLRGWELKPYAIIHSRFQEVILIDADNIPTIDPTVLFDWPEYVGTGAVFWPDVVRLKADNPIWELCGVAYRNVPTFESGQVLVDKRRCWPALQLTLFMNEHSDLYYRHVYGDKDTFFIAWLRLGQPFAMTPHGPGFLTEALYQKDFQGRTIFQHRTNSKWNYGGQNARVPRFQHEEACFALLEELHRIWNGLVFQPPAASEQSQRLAAELEEVRWFEYQRIGEGSRRLELLSANRIGGGRGDNAFYWWVAEDADGLALGLEGRRQTECRLSLRADGSWCGRSLAPDGWEIQLRPLRADGLPPWSSSSGVLADRAREEAGRLLDRLLTAVERRGSGAEALRDLLGALRLLAAEQPGFAATMAERLTGVVAPQSLAIRCLAVALAETAKGSLQETIDRSDRNTTELLSLLNRKYERSR